MTDFETALKLERSPATRTQPCLIRARLSHCFPAPPGNIFIRDELNYPLQLRRTTRPLPAELAGQADVRRATS